MRSSVNACDTNTYKYEAEIKQNVQFFTENSKSDNKKRFQIIIKVLVHKTEQIIIIFASW